MLINQKLLVSGAEYFDDGFAINAHMDDKIPVNKRRAVIEHDEIVMCFKQAGIEVIKVPAPQDCQDGVYTANWGLVIDGKAIMSNLPNKRKHEEPYAIKVLQELGIQTTSPPEDVRFSGQGDALPCGDIVFIGSKYRTDTGMQKIIENATGKTVIQLETIPQLDERYQPVINPITEWPDSFFYDLDLALAVIDEKTIAWCPEAFTEDSQNRIKSLVELDQIEVSMHEARNGFACNLVSTGETVIMSENAPNLRSELEKRGLKVLSPKVKELLKGGGFIRCTSLTLN